MHSLLRRQLRKCFGAGNEVSEQWREFVEAVNLAYHEFDADRGMMERCLELSSQELMQANSRMRAVLQAVPDLFLLLEDDGTVLRTLSAQTSDLYVPSARLVGRRIQDIPDEQVNRRMTEALGAALAQRTLASTEYSLTLGEREQHYEARFIPLVQNKVLAVIRNVSDQRRAEAERMKTSKLDSLGLLAGGIAHDFNNLLAGLLGNLSVVRAFHAHDSEEDQILADAELACHRARDLTQQLLTFSKGGAPIRTSASVRQLIRDVAVFALRGSKVRCDFQLAEDLLPVEIDVGQISQVIHNLTINSEQSMPEGGVITISASNIPATDQRCLPLPRRRYIEIVVADHGCGISPQHLPRVFDPYFSTKPQGSGLGLATSYSIVRNHDGLIALDSQLGAGTRVSVCLPAATDDPRSALARPDNFVVGHGRVLIMDDEPHVLRAAGRILRRMGFHPDLTRDGREAVEKCRDAVSAGDPYRFAILDLTIPGGVGGENAARALREVCPELKIIASSGYFDNAVITNHREFGFLDILPKPYSLRELNQVLLRIGL